MRHLLWIVLCLLLIGACSDDDNKPAPDMDGAPPVDQQVTPDQQGGPDGPVACNEGDKQCNGFEWIQVCTNGAWVDTIHCTDKKIGGQECYCSITLMYVCAVGANECQ